MVGIDVGTVSKSEALKRAQALCLVVSAELGVEAQTRDCITMASMVYRVAVFVSKVDVLDDSEQDAAATIVTRLQKNWLSTA